MARMTLNVYHAIRRRTSSRQLTGGLWEHTFDNDGLNEGVNLQDDRYICMLRMISNEPFGKDVARCFFEYQNKHTDFTRRLLGHDKRIANRFPFIPLALCAAALLAGFFGLQAVSESALPFWEGVGAIALILALEVPVVKYINRIA